MAADVDQHTRRSKLSPIAPETDALVEHAKEENCGENANDSHSLRELLYPSPRSRARH